MTDPVGEDVTATERGAEHVGCRYLAVAVETDGGPCWFCNKCGWAAPRSPLRPTYEQLEACVAEMRRDLDWAVGLLRQVQASPPAWWEGVIEFLDALDAEEATDG